MGKKHYSAKEEFKELSLKGTGKEGLPFNLERHRKTPEVSGVF